MRHHNVNRKFGRERKVRRALLRSLAINLIQAGRITTTTAKAKELRPYIEKLITVGKGKTLTKQRLILSRLGQVKATHRLVTEIAPRYDTRAGGYTRIIRLPARQGDASPLALIEFV